MMPLCQVLKNISWSVQRGQKVPWSSKEDSKRLNPNACIVPSLELTASLLLKVNGWKMKFLFGKPYFLQLVSLKEAS